MYWLRRTLILGLTTTIALANKDEALPVGPVEVGQSELIRVQPDLNHYVESNGIKVWQDSIHITTASFLKPHFVNLNLKPGDKVVIRSRNRIVEELTGRGPKNMGSFWGLSAFGELIIVEFHFTHD